MKKKRNETGEKYLIKPAHRQASHMQSMQSEKEEIKRKSTCNCMFCFDDGGLGSI